MTMILLRYIILLVLIIITIFQFESGEGEFGIMALFCTVIYGLWVFLNHDNNEGNNDSKHYKLT